MYYNKETQQIYEDKADIQKRTKTDLQTVNKLIDNGKYIYFKRSELAELMFRGVAKFGDIEYSTYNKLKP